MILDFLYYLSIVVLGGMAGYLIRDRQKLDYETRITEHHYEMMIRYHAAKEILVRHDLEHEYRELVEQLLGRE